MKNTPELTLTIEQAAEAIQVSRPTMLTLVHQSDFPSFRVGRRWMIPAAGLERWLDAQVERAQAERKVGVQGEWFNHAN